MREIPMLELYARQFKVDGPDIPAGRKGRLFARICAGQQPTRKKLALEMGIRPATVSDIMLELLDDGLVLESRPDQNLQKGRPEIILRPDVNRMVTMVYYTVSNTLICALINFSGETIYSAQLAVQANQFDNATFQQLILHSYDTALKQLPAESLFAGMVLSLPGIVDETNGIWRYSSHWPNLRDFSLHDLRDQLDGPVIITKNLSSELRARLALQSQAAQPASSLLLHWGYGIGAAFVRSGDTFDTHNNSLGEVGHCCVDLKSKALCKCGMFGCVEAEAGLWAISAAHKKREIPKDEWLFEQYLNDHAHLKIWDRSIDLLALSLRNLCLTLSPDQCIITGPFAQNTVIFSRLVARFEEFLPNATLVVKGNRAKIISGSPGTNDEIIGAASTVFNSALKKLCSD